MSTRSARPRAALAAFLIGGCVVWTAAVAPSIARSESLDSFEPGPSSLATNDDASALFRNPAAIDRSVSWGWTSVIERPAVAGAPKRWQAGLTFAGAGLGFQQRRDPNHARRDRWGIALGSGQRRVFALGLRGVRERRVGRAGTEAGLHGGSGWRFDVGGLYRPARRISFGAVVSDLNQETFADRLERRAYSGGVAVRPWPGKNPERLTLHVDLIDLSEETWKRARVDIGAECEPYRGLLLSSAWAKPLEGPARAATMRVALGLRFAQRTSALALAYDRQGRHLATRWGNSGHGDRQTPIWARPVLARIPISGVYGDASQISLDLPLPFLGAPSQRGVRPLLHALDRARADGDVKGLLLELGPVRMGALADEVRQAIAAIRAEGKPVVAFLRGGQGLGQYGLAAACDRIVLDPVSSLSGLGVRADLLYYGAFLDSLGLKPEKIEHGRYKTAGETLVRSTPSAGQLESLNALIDDRREAALAEIASARGLSRAALDSLTDGRILESTFCLEAGLVDSLGEIETAERILRTLSHHGGARLSRVDDRRPRRDAWHDGPRVVVLWLDGSIEGGENGSSLLGGNVLGARTVVRDLERLAARSEVRTVVLRIDSPGGSAFASDEIWRAVERLKRRGKTVIASMSRVAASGGYYIACGADEIVADPGTVTGSIGVVLLKPDFHRFYQKHDLGVATFERGAYMGLYSGATALSPELRAHYQSKIDRLYGHFLDRVAAGRPLSRDEIDEVGEGRVWTGRQARDRGLVDHLGGLDVALGRARARAGLDADATVEHQVRRSGPWLLTRLLSGLQTQDPLALLFGTAPELGRSLPGEPNWRAESDVPLEWIAASE